MQWLMIKMRKILDKLVRPFGLAVVTARETEMTYFHHYKGGYEEYKETQIYFNKKKLNSELYPKVVRGELEKKAAYLV